jgi:hypothetical protein
MGTFLFLLDLRRPAASTLAFLKSTSDFHFKPAFASGYRHFGRI